MSNLVHKHTDKLTKQNSPDNNKYSFVLSGRITETDCNNGYEELDWQQ